jgi:large repetitive protein
MPTGNEGLDQYEGAKRMSWINDLRPRAGRSFSVWAIVFGLCAGMMICASASPQDRIFKSGFEANGSLTLTRKTPEENDKIPSDQFFRTAVSFVVPTGVREATSIRVDGALLTDCQEYQPDSSTIVVFCDDAIVRKGIRQIEVRYGKWIYSWPIEAIERAKFSDFVPAPSSKILIGSPIVISARLSATSSPIDPQSIAMKFEGAEVGSSLTVTNVAPGEYRLSFVLKQSLPADGYSVEYRARSIDGILSERSYTFEVVKSRDYTIEIESPAADTITKDSKLLVKLRVNTSASNVSGIWLNDVEPEDVSEGGNVDLYEISTGLNPGANSLRLRVEFEDGTIRELTRVVIYDAAPLVTITTPADFSIFGAVPIPNASGSARNLTGNVERPVTITGIVSRTVTSVLINQQAAVLSPDRKSFQFANFFLREGTNLISAIATDELGRSGVANRTVYVDQTAPLVTIESPAASAVTSNATIDVRGLAIDAVEASVGASELEVTVKNLSNDSTVAAVVSDRYFFAQDLTLEVGSNVLEVKAIDSLGNSRTKTVTVSRIATGSKRIVAIGGNRQSSGARGALAQSFKVAALDSNGNALQNFPIRFDVVRGNGSISSSAAAPTKPDGVNLARNLVINTNESGLTEVWMTVGSEAAPGGNSVRAWNESIGEDVLFTATTMRGVPAFANVDGNGVQFVAANSAPVDALSTVILDASMNRLIDVPVRYQILIGKARFTSESAPNAKVSLDGQSLTVNTDKNGVAAARPIAGEPGKVMIISGAQTAINTVVGQARFDLMVLERKSGPTQFSGVVMDHTGKPLSGVRLAISRTNLIATSDTNGRFLFSDQVPPGKIDLFVDGRSATAPVNTEYPALHFETAIVQGQVNQLPHAIYLPQINRSNSQVVGGNQDVTLTIPGYQGFELIVKANSVTFPDGSKIGPLVVSPVHNDRLPMVPPGGSSGFGTLGWTIQPSGTRFDPPAQVKIPNPGKMQAGETAQIVQWDHDLATFVPMGRGTVSEDRTQIITDFGSGITKAGWGGCAGPDCPPSPPNCGEGGPSCRGGQCGCNDCEKTQTGIFGACKDCIPDILKAGQPCQNNKCKKCDGSACVQKFRETVVGQTSSSFNHLHNAALEEKALNGPRGQHRPGPRSNPSNLEQPEWIFEFLAFCNPSGNWKFKLKKADISDWIFISNSPDAIWEDRLSIISPTISSCKAINWDELDIVSGSLVLSASPPEIFNCLQGGEPNPPDWTPPFPGYPRKSKIATFAHELVHRARFVKAMDDNFLQFRNEVEMATLAMLPNETAKAAAKRFNESNEFINLRNKLVREVYRLITPNGNDHYSEIEFFNASQCSSTTRGWIKEYDQRRVSVGCAVERSVCESVIPGMACSGVQ